jgi:hypothetical protein
MDGSITKPMFFSPKRADCFLQDTSMTNADLVAGTNTRDWRNLIKVVISIFEKKIYDRDLDKGMFESHEVEDVSTTKYYLVPLLS